MKKYILIIISVFLLLGCTINSDTDFTFKESCAKYIDDAKDRYEGYEGTYYSKGKSTCMSIYWDFGLDDTRQKFIRYYDEFSGKLRWFNEMDLEIKKQQLEFQKELKLVW